MSRSSYNTTTNQPIVEDRDYESRRERERDRLRNADRYDADSRHHGKWTASGESRDLNTGDYDVQSTRRAGSGGLRNRSYSGDRDDFQSSRGQSNYGNNYDNYGNIPTPPPMPPSDFYEPHGSYRQSHNGSGYGGYGSSGYGSSGYGGYGSSGYGSSGLGGYGSSGYGSSGYGSSGYGSGLGGYGGGYGSSGLGGYGSSGLGGYGSSGLGGYGSSGYGMHPHHLYLLQLQQSGYGSGMGGYGSGQGDYYFGQPHGSSGSSGLGGLLGGLGGSSRSRGLGGSQSQLGGQGFGGQGYRPAADIYELGNDYVIEMDLPGHSRDHIETKLYGNELIVISKPPARTFNFHVNERSHLGQGSIQRKFYLPQDVQTGQVNAALTNGVLKLIIPRNMNQGLNQTGAQSGLNQSGLNTQSGLNQNQGTKTVVTDTVSTTTNTSQTAL